MTEYDIVWNGSHRDTYLCIPDYRAADLSYVKPVSLPASMTQPYEHRGRERELILRFLAARPSWSTLALRIACAMDRSTFNGVLNRLVAKGHVERLSYMVVALRSERSR